MSRSVVFFTIVATQAVAQLVDWLYGKFYDSLITLPNLKAGLDFVMVAISYAAGPFGLGVAVGSLIFCVWDLPYIGRYLKRFMQKRMNASSNSEIAEKCSRMSKILFEHNSNLDRIWNENRWNPSDKSSDMISIATENNKRRERETDRFISLHGEEIKSLYITLRHKGVNVHLGDLRLIQWRFLETSILFEQIALALRSNSYSDGRHFKISDEGSVD